MAATRALTALILFLSLYPGIALAHRGAQPLANILLARNRTEPVVAVDPLHPSFVVAGSNTNYGQSVNGAFPVGVYRSGNGGGNFVASSMPVVSPYTTGADSTVAIARDGTVFFSYLGETPAVCEGGESAVVVAHSTDHGRSFRQPVVADRSSADDKPNMAVESGQRDHVFLVWDRLYAHHTEIWFTRSTDGGAHFETPRVLYSSALDNYGPVPVVGRGNHVYVFWSNFPDRSQSRSVTTRIVMKASLDDGRRFGSAHRVAGPFRAIPQLTPPGSLRNLTMPAAVAGASGSLWLAWARPTARYASGRVDANILLKRSVDEGKTWSSPVSVNDVAVGDRFMPALTTWPDGSVGIAFYDRRQGAALLDVFAARAWYREGIQVSRNMRLTRESTRISDIPYIAPGSTCFSPGRFFGDYLGVAAGPGRTLCATWADVQVHVSGETDIWFTRQSMPRSPSAR